MAQYRVLNRAFIGGRLVAMGDIVDLDPSQVSTRDAHLEPTVTSSSSSSSFIPPAPGPIIPTPSSIMPGHIAYVTGEPPLMPASTEAPAVSEPNPSETEHP